MFVLGKCSTDGELVEAKHVHDADAGDSAAVELRPLVDACTHKQAAVGRAVDGQALGARVLFADQELGRSLCWVCGNVKITFFHFDFKN